MKARQTYIEIDGVVQPAPAPRFSRTVPTPPGPPKPATPDEAMNALDGWLGQDRMVALREAGVLP